ncbi:MAG: hypothetical protein ABI051_15225 [Vicinamibacterales bacterium]
MSTAVGFGCSKKTPSGPSATLASLTLSPATIAGGNPVQGTVTLSGVVSDPAAVALVSNNAAATVPSSVGVSAGSSTGTFSVTTTTVATSTPVTVSASFGGTTQTAALVLTPPALTASFTVASLSAAQRKLGSDPTPVTLLPAGSADACPLVNSANPSLDCQFNGTASTPSASITAYVWTYSFGNQTKTETSTNPIFKPTMSGCASFGGQSGSSSGGLQFIAMRVDLKVRNAAGTESAVTTNQNVRIFPAGICGYGF